MKKVLTKQIVYKSENVKEEVELFEEPRFYQHHNYRVVEAIFPKAYNYSETCFGVEYTIYTAEDGRISKATIRDSMLFQNTGSNRARYFESIERNYPSDISEETFWNCYNTFVSEVVINKPTPQ